MSPTEKDPLQKRVEWTNLALLAALLALSVWCGSPRFTVGILCGGLISIINFHWLYRSLLKVFTKQLHRAKMALMVRYYLRLAITAAILYWLISGHHIDVIGLVIGLSVVVLSLVITTALALSKKHPIGEVES